MFKIFLKNKRGFTIVELIIVLLLLSVGVFAMANMMKVTYRAFKKSEERSIKQEAVKIVADRLQRGSASVCSAQTADIFNTVDVKVIKDEKIENLKCKLIIDLSTHGGLSLSKAENLGIKSIKAPGLPAKVAPDTAAEILRNTVLHIINSYNY